jgi:hypothetical protein
MSQESVQETRKRPPVRAGARWLTPETTQVFQGTYSLLHCSVRDDTTYRGVFAVLMFPISHPDQFVSLRYTDREDKVQEVGVIENLKEFPPEAQDLIRRSLTRQTHEKIIREIYEVKEEFGLLFFYVRTDEGWEQFVMPWRGDRAEDWSENGKLLLDAYDNRYVVPDLDELPPPDRERLTYYVYW